MATASRRLIPLLLLLALLAAPGGLQGQEARLSYSWQPGRLIVNWSAPAAVCPWLLGGGLEDTVIPIPQCSAGGQIALAISGGDARYTPLGRRALELRGAGGTIARIDLDPPNQQILPIIVRSQ